MKFLVQNKTIKVFFLFAVFAQIGLSVAQTEKDILEIEKVAEYLKKGYEAEALNNVVQPKGESAAFYYQQILELDPFHAKAYNQLSLIRKKFTKDYQAALERKDFPATYTAIANLKISGEQPYVLSDMEQAVYESYTSLRKERALVVAPAVKAEAKKEITPVPVADTSIDEQPLVEERIENLDTPLDVDGKDLVVEELASASDIDEVVMDELEEEMTSVPALVVVAPEQGVEEVVDEDLVSITPELAVEAVSFQAVELSDYYPAMLLKGGDTDYQEFGSVSDAIWVDVSFHITRKGAVENVVVVESNGPEGFKEAVTRNVRDWSFTPAIHKDTGVKEAVRVNQLRITLAPI